MKILIACEFSGAIRNSYRNLGEEAWSCDLLDSEDTSSWHLKCDVKEILNENWDLMIAHPPCTHLSVSGARWFKSKEKEQKEALKFVEYLLNSNVKHIALENPISIISTKIRKPDQIIQPWMFGHGETKATCLWLKNLPLLSPTNIVSGREPRIHKMGPSPERGKLRSKTYPGIAEAIANQWNSKTLV